MGKRGEAADGTLPRLSAVAKAGCGTDHLYCRTADCTGAVSEFLRGGEYEKKGVSDQPDAGE